MTEEPITHEQRVRILELAASLGLSSMYDASRDSYPNWAKKVLAFAQQLRELES